MRFATRARIERTQLYRRRIHLSDCGQYRVSEMYRVLEGRWVYYAERKDAYGWDVIGHGRRTLAAAEVACERHAREQGGKPRKKVRI